MSAQGLWKKVQTVLQGHCCPLKSLTGVNWPYWLALMCLLFVCLPSLSVSEPQETCSIVINCFWMQGAPLYNVVWSVWSVKAVNKGSCDVWSSALDQQFCYSTPVSSPRMWWPDMSCFYEHLRVVPCLCSCFAFKCVLWAGTLFSVHLNSTALYCLTMIMVWYLMCFCTVLATVRAGCWPLSWFHCRKLLARLCSCIQTSLHNLYKFDCELVLLCRVCLQ